MKASPVGYVRNAELRGRLFDSEDTSGRVSSVDTGFLIHHGEPLQALEWVRSRWTGPWANSWMVTNLFLFYKQGVVLGLGLLHRAAIIRLEPVAERAHLLYACDWFY